MIGGESFINPNQRRHRPVLVIELVELREIDIKVSAQVLGAGRISETGKRHAITLTSVADLALEQCFTDEFPVLSPRFQSTEPACAKPCAPLASPKPIDYAWLDLTQGSLQARNEARPLLGRFPGLTKVTKVSMQEAHVKGLHPLLVRELEVIHH